MPSVTLSLSYVTFDVVWRVVLFKSKIEEDKRKNTWGREFVYTDSLNKLPSLIKQKIPCPLMSPWYPKKSYVLHLYALFTDLTSLSFFSFLFYSIFLLFYKNQICNDAIYSPRCLIICCRIEKTEGKVLFCFFYVNKGLLCFKSLTWSDKNRFSISHMLSLYFIFLLFLFQLFR